ncbi:hypothetical protein KKA96_04160 [Patescibacteria group bacterium]|nr:hypothetical protein [Patescibacteria group bacterium]
MLVIPFGITHSVFANYSTAMHSSVYSPRLRYGEAGWWTRPYSGTASQLANKP